MNQISTENLSLLPNPIELQKICKSIAVLEAILCQDWEFRHYSYQKEWSKTEEVCEMRNGQGDQMLILFSKYGTCLNGFAHESKMNGWKKVITEQEQSFIEKILGIKKEPKTKLVQEISNGVLDGLPKMFYEFIYSEPVKSIGTTFCIWQTKTDNEWKTGQIKLPNDEYKDGSIDLLQLLDGQPSTYKNWAEEYYAKALKQEAIDKVFKGELITRSLIVELNPEIEDYEKLQSDLEAIGYETSSFNKF